MNFKLVACCFLILYPSFIFSQRDTVIRSYDTIVCLKVMGIALSKKEPIDGVAISLYRENEELVWEEITNIPYHDHSFSFDLLGNSSYSILISKAGYISRLVSINTSLPDSVPKSSTPFFFEFEVDLFKEKSAGDDFYLDFPIALISYNTVSGVFENHDDYTKHIKEKMFLGIKPKSSAKKK